MTSPLTMGSHENLVDLLPLPAAGVHRVQEAGWADVWGPTPQPLGRYRAWLRQQVAACCNRGDLGNRFADPQGQYRETYGATCLVGGLLETWADDMPNEATVIAGRKVRRTTWDPAHEVGVLPAARIDDRVVIRMGRPGVSFVDLSAVRTRTWLIRQVALRRVLLRAGVTGPRIDSGMLEGSGARSRAVTQCVSKVFHEHPLQLDGLRYRTKLGGDHHNWAIFAKSPIALLDRQPLRRTDPAVFQALHELGLRLPP